MKEFELKNNRLRITLELCDANEQTSTRFDRACRVKSIILGDKYEFAQPEQKIAERRSSNGFGLSSEWVVNGLGEKTKAGEYFFKPGVGLLLQSEDFKPYDIFEEYECIPSKTTYSTNESMVIFTEAVMDDAFPISFTRKISLLDNQIKIMTIATNFGNKELSLLEYQHNFFATNDMPVGPGYKLSVPYIRDMTKANWESSGLDETGAPCCSVPMPLDIAPQHITWNCAMAQNAYYVSFPAEEIIPSSQYKWQLSYDNCPITISELMNFKPARQDIWGVEHCVCAEAFKEIHLKAGESETYTRTWTFED